MRRREKYTAFTLIELLIAAAIIAILAAIAIPNFLEAQTRSKISRIKADMQSTAAAIESYHIDNNNYPPGYNTAARFGIDALTTPISYLTANNIFDPFKPPGGKPSQMKLTYELENADGKILEKGGDAAYTVDPTIPGAANTKGIWWWLASRGPNTTFGFKSSEPEYNLYKRFYEANTNMGALLDVIYDPTNGTISGGNIYHAGGELNAAGQEISSK